MKAKDNPFKRRFFCLVFARSAVYFTGLTIQMKGTELLSSVVLLLS